MGNNYRLRIIKAGATPVECAGKIAGDVLQLARANGEVLYGFPLGRVAGLSHPSPNLIKVKVVVSESSVGTLELQEAGVGGGYAPITALYSELVKSLEGMRGKKRHRAVSMDPISMSDFLKQQARAAGAPMDPTAFLTLDGGAPNKAVPAPQAVPQVRPAPSLPASKPLVTNAAFEQDEAPGMFDDEDTPTASKAVRFGDLGAEVQAMRVQLQAAQQRLSSQAANHNANITTLERRIATLQEAMTAAQHAEANIGRQANEQLRAVIAERDAALQRTQEALQAREATLAELAGSQAQLAEFEQVLGAAQREAEERSRELEAAQEERGLLRSQLDALVQDRDQVQQQAGELAEALQGSQQDAELLAQALEAFQATLVERSAAYEAQIGAMRETLAQAEEAINATNSALAEAQASIARLEEELASASQRLQNADMSGGELQQALEDTQAALRQAQGQSQASANQIGTLEEQVARGEAELAAADASRAVDQSEVAQLRGQLEELQGAVGQAVEEIEAQNVAFEAQNAAQVQQQAEREALLTELSEARAQAEAHREGEGSLQKQVDSLQAELTAVSTALAASKEEVARLQQSESVLREGGRALVEAERRIADLEAQLAQAKMIELADQSRAGAEAQSSQEMEGLQQQLRVAQTAVAALQSELASKLAPLPESSDSRGLQDEVRQLHEELRLAKSSYQSSSKEASKDADEDVVRLSNVEAELRTANRELEQVVPSRERLHKENLALAAQLDMQQQQHKRRDSAAQRLRQSPQSLEENQVSELQEKLEGAEAAALAADKQVARLEADVQIMREMLTKAQKAAALAQEQSSQASTSESAAAARKLRHLEIQLADAETRAQSHAAILERHQLRKDAQEKKIAALQAKLNQLQRVHEDEVASLQEEANARLVQSEHEGKEERQAMRDAAERANAVISQLQEENERLAVELAEAQNQAREAEEGLQLTRQEAEDAQGSVARLSSQLANVTEQGEFDSARCVRLQQEVAALTRHLQDTNSDLQQSNRVIEALEAAGLNASAQVRQPTLRPPQLKTSSSRVSSLIEEEESPKRAPSAESIGIQIPMQNGFGSAAAARDRIASIRTRSVGPEAAAESPSKPSLALSKAVVKASDYHGNMGSAQKPSRASLALDIEAASKLLQHLSTRLEAAGLPTPPSSRRQSSGRIGSPTKNGFLVKGIHGNAEEWSQGVSPSGMPVVVFACQPGSVVQQQA